MVNDADDATWITCQEHLINKNQHLMLNSDDWTVELSAKDTFQDCQKQLMYKRKEYTIQIVLRRVMSNSTKHFQQNTAERFYNIMMLCVYPNVMLHYSSQCKTKHCHKKHHEGRP